MTKIGIIGGSGYAGGEVIRILSRHEDVEIESVTSRNYAEEYLYRAHPNLRGVTDLKFEELDADKIYEARLKEVEHVNQKHVWVKIPRSKAKEMGWKVLKARWIDINKGDGQSPMLRSRYVGKEFNDGPMEGLFAGT